MNRQDWATPWPLVRLLEERYGGFTVDGAATANTAKACRYFADAFNERPTGERIFVNPPYRTLGP